MQKLVGFGDHRTSNIVAKIAEEEVAHVAVGVYWFNLVCQKMGRIPCASFKGKCDLYLQTLPLFTDALSVQQTSFYNILT